MGNYLTIDPVGLQALLADSAVLIDVRTDNEVERGRIAGAFHIPLHRLPARLSEITPDGPVVVYCQSGARSAMAGRFLADNGCRQVYNLSGGIGAWLAHGFPIERKG
ncbi:MAG: rhodanese-like domain-containing protein [Betaproteobacteria bacterium]